MNDGGVPEHGGGGEGDPDSGWKLKKSSGKIWHIRESEESRMTVILHSSCTLHFMPVVLSIYPLTAVIQRNSFSALWAPHFSYSSGNSHIQSSRTVTPRTFTCLL